MSVQQSLQTYEAEACQKVWVWLNYQIDHFKDNPNGYSPVHPATPPPRTSPRATTPQCSPLFAPRSPNASPVIIFPGTAEPISQNPTEIYQYNMEPAQEPVPSPSPTLADILKLPPPPPPRDYPPFYETCEQCQQQRLAYELHQAAYSSERPVYEPQQVSSPERESPESPNSQSYKFDPIYIEEMKKDHTEAAYRIKKEVRRAAREKRRRERNERREARRLKKEEEERLLVEDERRIEEAAKEVEEANRLAEETERAAEEAAEKAPAEKKRIPHTTAEDFLKLHLEVQQVVDAYFRNSQAMSMGMNMANIQPIEKLCDTRVNTWNDSAPFDPLMPLPDLLPSTSHDPETTYDAGTKVMNQSPEIV